MEFLGLVKLLVHGRCGPFCEEAEQEGAQSLNQVLILQLHGRHDPFWVGEEEDREDGQSVTLCWVLTFQVHGTHAHFFLGELGARETQWEGRVNRGHGRLLLPSCDEVSGSVLLFLHFLQP